MDSTATGSGLNKGKSRHLAACFLPQVISVLFAVGLFHRGFWLCLPFVFLFVLMPLLDTLTGWQDDGSYQKSDFARPAVFLLRWNARLYVMFYLAALIFVLSYLRRFTLIETGCALVSLSVLGAVGFAAAHELLHCREKLDQVLQRITTTFLFYPHYR